VVKQEPLFGLVGGRHVAVAEKMHLAGRRQVTHLEQRLAEETVDQGRLARVVLPDHDEEKDLVERGAKSGQRPEVFGQHVEITEERLDVVEERAFLLDERAFLGREERIDGSPVR
jgi:hypothetical protein